MDSFSCWKDKYRAVKVPIIGDSEILSFISNYLKPPFCSNSWKFFITEHYLSGGCYWFAIILKERFAAYKPIIWYDTIENHFITEINGILYDASGVYYPASSEKDYDEYYIWQDYKNFDPIHAERIQRQCIDYNWEKDNG